MLLLGLGLHDHQTIQRCHDRPQTVRANHRVRNWPKADTPKNAFNVAFGGKADMAYCSANVCF
jgi:hypothetical protein